MTGDGGIEGRCFSDLPGDLLGAICRSCSTSYDRARFAAVCKSWRAAASWQPKLPALPLLLPWTCSASFDRKTRAYSPEDGRPLRAPLPWFPYGKQIAGSHDGGWVAAAFGCRVDVVNLFTGASVVKDGQIMCRCPETRETTENIFIEKVVFSKDPSSEGCILAAITSGYLSTERFIALFRLGGTSGGWTTTQGCGIHPRPLFDDIAFCNGELYGLLSGGLLYKYSIGLNKGNAPVVTSLVELTVETPLSSFDPQYIFELHGKLATTVEVKPVRSSKARILRVFELANNTTSRRPYKCTWAEVSSLGDHALFLGQGCCKAVSVSRARGEVERNRIYYYYHYEEQHLSDSVVDTEVLDSLNLGSCHVCCYENEVVHHLEKIVSRGYQCRERHVGYSHRTKCTWIFPPQF